MSRYGEIFEARLGLYRSSSVQAPTLWVAMGVRQDKHAARDRAVGAYRRPPYDVIFRENVFLYLFGRGTSPILVG